MLAQHQDEPEFALASATRRRDGAGRGLAICRSLCEHMGGTIAVVSAPGQGTSFTVELPLRPSAEGSQAHSRVIRRGREHHREARLVAAWTHGP